MKKTIIYIHGGNSYKSREEFLEHLRTVPLREVLGEERPKRWPDSLATDLGEAYQVYQPVMPNKQNASYEEWKIWFLRYVELVKDTVILVGWSQGAWLLAKYLAENTPDLRIDAVFLIAGPSGLVAESGGDNPEWAFDLNQLRQRLEMGGVKTYIFHSKDDPVVPYSHAVAYKIAIPQAELVTFTDKGHFLVPELPELIRAIKEIS